MAATFSTYSFYKDDYHGRLSEDEYLTYVQRARAEILSVITIDPNSVPSMKDNLSFCECELVDAYSKLDSQEGILSENNDGLAVTYDKTFAKSQYREICNKHLQYPYNLMCRWL